MISAVPANEASREDLQAVFGDRGDPHRCQCQYFKTTGGGWAKGPVEERAAALYAQTRCGDPTAPATTGLVAYLDGEPAGWCAVEPRSAYRRLRAARVPWAGRAEDRDDPGVWAVTCFVTRAGFRRRGVSTALAKAAADLARDRGAAAAEGYPMVVEPGADVPWPAELYVGTVGVFAAAGFAEVSRPTPRRAVMRIDFGVSSRP
ncbi:GNAT family N-acetyltransferase [Dactylosporangium sp. NPDC051485]|uniref:GNAT family N-acetyltransferase n=1 Tax=Dactylosporangium sp. NPDC051485 TaxID=3154846 RepID=UPI00341651FA